MDVDLMMAQLRESLVELHIPIAESIEPRVKINSRAKKRLGCCVNRNNIYTIEVSQSIVADEKLLRQTLAHELLHTCKGCGNHGALWKYYAAAVSQALGVNIRRTEKAAPENARGQTEPKYLLVCMKCGAQIARERLSKPVKYPWRYRCRCGGKLKRQK